MSWAYWLLIGGVYAAVCAIVFTMFVAGARADRIDAEIATRGKEPRDDTDPGNPY